MPITPNMENDMKSASQVEFPPMLQTRVRGTNEDEFEIFLFCADDGKGGDLTNEGKPLPTFEEWLIR